MWPDDPCRADPSDQLLAFMVQCSNADVTIKLEEVVLGLSSGQKERTGAMGPRKMCDVYDLV